MATRSRCARRPRVPHVVAVVTLTSGTGLDRNVLVNALWGVISPVHSVTNVWEQSCVECVRKTGKLKSRIGVALPPDQLPRR